MTTRRDFLSGLAVAAAAIAFPYAIGTPLHPTESLRDIETVQAGEELSIGVHEVFLDGRPVHARAMNVKEGWVDVVDVTRSPPLFERRYGEVTYTLL